MAPCPASPDRKRTEPPNSPELLMMPSPEAQSDAQISGSALPPFVDPLPAAMQQRIRTLLQEVRGALQRHQLSPEVETEIARLVTELEPGQAPHLVPQLLAEAIAHHTLSPQAQQQVQTLVLKQMRPQRSSILVEQVRDALQNEILADPVQTELSQLLALLPHASDRPDLMDEFDLAIAALVSPTPANQPRNLRFSRSLRRQLAMQLQQNPNPLRSIVSASGSSHNRLVAGLSWFLLVFTIVPTVMSAIFFASGVTRQYHEIQALEVELADSRDQVAAASDQVATLTNSLNTARQGLVSLQRTQIKADPPPPESLQGLLDQQQTLQQQIETTLSQTQAALKSLDTKLRNSLDTVNTEVATAADLPRDELRDQITEALNQLTQLQARPILRDAGSDRPATTALQTQVARLQAELDQVDQAIAAITLAMAEATLPGSNPPPVPGSPPAPVAETPVIDIPASTEEDAFLAVLNTLLNNINNVNLPLILAVVATGALGSFVSVIVRASEFIDQEQKSGLDLFLVGFFRPIVGMAFAFFLVAVLESGIFSGFLSVNAVKPEKKIYLYVAIAFVAGFSERLVKDIVGQTASMVGAKQEDP